jgi:ribose transport system permease protein
MGYLAMVVIFSVLLPDTFLTMGTLRDLLNQAAVPVIIACGVTFTVTVGEFDLSFPAVVSIAGGAAVWLISVHDVGVAYAIAAGMLVAGLSGLAVGSIVVFGGASSFIITLALSSILNGIEWSITGNVQIFNNIPDSFAVIANSSLFGFKTPVWLMFAVVVVSVFMLHWTTFGRHVYAIGGNERAAFLAGIRIKVVRISCYVLVGIFAGVAAIILTSTASSYYPALSAGLLLSSFASLFLGAAMAASNRFTVLGSAMGVVWLLTLQTGLTQLSEPAWVSTLVQGIVLAAAVLLAVRGRKGKTV